MVKATEIMRQAYVLKDRADCCANLIIGKDKALIFDMGCGTDNMLEAVRGITDLPLLAIASHGHFDHIGGSCYMEKVYMHEEDMAILQLYDNELLNQWIRQMVPEWERDISFGADEWTQIHPLDFAHFDLGDMECRVMPMPGHTKGSVGIWIPSLKLLLTGDALTPVMCLQFPNHLTKKDQLKTLRSLKNLDFDCFLTSHYEKSFPKSLIERMEACIQRSFQKKHYAYQYPNPPFSKGWFYLDSIDEEAVGVIVAEEDY